MYIYEHKEVWLDVCVCVCAQVHKYTHTSAHMTQSIGQKEMNKEAEEERDRRPPPGGASSAWHRVKEELSAFARLSSMPHVARDSLRLRSTGRVESVGIRKGLRGRQCDGRLRKRFQGLKKEKRRK